MQIVYSLNTDSLFSVLTEWVSKISWNKLKLIDGLGWEKIVCITMCFIFFTLETYTLKELCLHHKQ